MNITVKPEWSAPYYGCQHFHVTEFDPFWATVDDHGEWAELLKWYPGCGFSPIHEDYPNAAEARDAGEAWVLANMKNVRHV